MPKRLINFKTKNINGVEKYSFYEVKEAFDITRFDSNSRRHRIIASKFFKECDLEDLDSLTKNYGISIRGVKHTYSNSPEKKLKSVQKNGIEDLGCRLKNEKLQQSQYQILFYSFFGPEIQMYSFLEQEKMLKIALQMLDEKGLLAHSTLGGGTALARSYWDHRYSTDIDIFIYTNEVGGIELLTQDKWSTKTKADMKSIGYTGDNKFNYAYLEFSIAEQCKIHFFDVSGFTTKPTVIRSLWGNININIESVEEIIAKKFISAATKQTQETFSI